MVMPGDVSGKRNSGLKTHPTSRQLHNTDYSASTIEDMCIMSLSRSHEGSCAT